MLRKCGKEVLINNQNIAPDALHPTPPNGQAHLPQPHDWIAKEARLAILDDIKKVGIPIDGLPGPVVPFRPNAFPILTAGRSPRCVAAAATWGRGRVACVGHSNWMRDVDLEDPGKKGRFMANIIRWVAGGKPRPRFSKLPPNENSEVVIWTGEESVDQELLKSWVYNGGGLVCALAPWAWMQKHPGLSLKDDFPVNKVLAPIGLAFAAGKVVPTSGKSYAIAESNPKGAHPLRVLSGGAK
eukprot:gene21959-1275_t